MQRFKFLCHPRVDCFSDIHADDLWCSVVEVRTAIVTLYTGMTALSLEDEECEMDTTNMTY